MTTPTPTTATTPMTPSASRRAANHALIRLVTEWVIICPVCELDFPGHTDMAEAAYLASVHDHIHHGGRREAFTVPLSDPLRDPAIEAGGVR